MAALQYAEAASVRSSFPPVSYGGLPARWMPRARLHWLAPENGVGPANSSRISLKSSTQATRHALQRHSNLAERTRLQSRGTRGSARVTCNLVEKVTAKRLDELLGGDRPLPMVIDFYATWCGPCILLAQQLEQLAVEYHGEVQFLKVDTDEEYELANQLEIRGLPTMVFVSRDKTKLATRTEGLLPVETIKTLIAEL